ncbi:hypothetical protein TSAR_006603 [Trichomalopsis sarcophagae]|uniref:Uncharacterized protein n=1 Tax=Trichomalopsis sarcophagae TaxID=543379 RepID=A0A232F0G8_9HYME|nr:hypothetical protein TSAR_006603 [Trichomalopsis sarcophagae]
MAARGAAAYIHIRLFSRMRTARLGSEFSLLATTPPRTRQGQQHRGAHTPDKDSISRARARQGQLDSRRRRTRLAIASLSGGGADCVELLRGESV